MGTGQTSPLRYSVLDPTGNITALVESDVSVDLQPSVAAELMRRHPEVEQVGFTRFADSVSGEGIHGEVRMAGGEFCGNATMSAAALYLLRRERQGHFSLSADDPPVTVRLRSSGAARPVEVRLRRETPNGFRAGVLMPAAVGIEEREVSYGNLRGRLPLIRMEGISHVILEPGSAFFALLHDRNAAERAVRDWCGLFSADGLGLMFLEGNGAARHLTPLVYVPGSGTVFWENSCASGSSAAGMYLAARGGAPVNLTLLEPGGELRVESDPSRGETRLYGRVRLIQAR